MTRDGQRAFVGLGRANHVAFVDVRARKVTQLVLAGKRAWNVSLDKAEGAAVRRQRPVRRHDGRSTSPTAKALKTVPVGRVPYQAVVVE